MGTVVRRERRPFGAIANDTRGMAITHGQVGGEGVCRWKMLMNGMHLEGNWNCVEYVVIEPGGSVGAHVHMRTEEIYYILRGTPVVTVNGVEHPCRPGDLVTTPIGCEHSIANRTGEDMHFFVVEVFPGEGPPSPSVQVNVPALAGDGGSVDVDLTPHFTGDWRRFRLLEIPPGGRDESESPSTTEVLLVVEGAGAVTVRGERYGGDAGDAGLAVGVPPRTARVIENTDAARPLRVIITEVAAV